MGKPSEYKRHFGFAESHFGSNTYGHDVKMFGDTDGKYTFWDASADTLYVVGTLSLDGTFNADDIAFTDNESLTFGTGSDVSIKWDGTNLVITAAADDEVIEIGDSSAAQKSFDLKWYGNANNGADYLYFDASANLVYTTGIDMQFKDNDYAVFGTGAGAAGDLNIHWDGTNLIVDVAADDTLIELGDSAATQLSLDLKWYGNEANGTSYVYFDASENLIYTTGIDLQFKDNDYLVFGTGSDGTGDINIRYDGNSLIIETVDDDNLIEIGDSAATQKSLDLKWYGGDSSGASYMYWDASRNLLKSKFIEISQRRRFEVFDDFVQQTFTEADTPWVLNSGNDAQAIDPDVTGAECGALLVQAGDADGTMANDGSQIVCDVPMYAQSGGLVFEARLHINTAITGISVNAGFTDSQSLEEPFSGNADSLTSVASDAVCFLFDDGNTTKEWFAAAVDSNTDDANNGAVSVAPAADTYQVLRIEVSSDGVTCKFYIDEVLVATLDADAGISPDVALYATVTACSTTTTAKSVDVDYIYCGHNR